MILGRGDRVSFRRLDAKICDIETLDAKKLGPRTPGRQKKKPFGRQFLLHFVKRKFDYTHPKETRNKEPRKRTRKKQLNY